MVNLKSSFDNQDVFTKAISDMVDASAASFLPIGVISTIVKPLGVVPKPHSDKLRLVVNVRFMLMNISSSEYSSSKVFQT
jgi:hypothetical protein